MPKKSLIKKADKAWSHAVKVRASHKCEVCGKKATNSHHYISRSNRMLRWDLGNGIAVCAGCHLFANKSFHKNPEWGHEWMEKNRKKELGEIQKVMYNIKKWTDEELQERYDELRKEYLT